MRSNESSEDYLETILILGNRSSLVRAVDIAAEIKCQRCHEESPPEKSHHSSR